MPDVSSVLKIELTRVARKALKAELDALRRTSASFRKEIAALKRAVSALQRGQKSAEKIASKAKASATEENESAAEAGTRARMSAKGLKTLRTKLGLSAAEFGQLAGASGQSIYNWEQGKNAPRAKQLEALVALRKLGKREARARLEALAVERR